MNSRKFTVKSITVLVISIICNSALAISKDDVTVNNYGIFAHSPDNGKSWINPVSDAAIKGTTGSPVHILSTREVPAKHPLFFGFEYNIKNLKENTIDIVTEVTHPKIKQSDGSETTNYQHTQKFLVLDGKITATKGYLLENKNEAQTGDWVFKIKLNGQIIIKQQFTVVDK